MTDSVPGPAQRHLDTLLAHAGGNPFDRHGAVNPPIYRASTIVFPTVAAWEASRDPARRFDVVRYGQLGTPTTFALEEAVTALEGAYRTALVPSGLAAVTTTLLALLKPGDHLLMVNTAYPPTRHFCEAVLGRFGIATTWYDPGVGGGISALLRPETRVVFVESPGSFTFEVQDLPAIAAAAHAAGVIVVADTSWAGPYLHRALEHGADVSVQAGTKYLAGHADLMLGTIATTEPCYLPIRTLVAELGLCVSPDDAYLALRGMRTLGVRMERHQRNALQVATWLSNRAEVTRVLYPALPDDPGYALWRRDFRGASGLFGVVLAPAPEAAVHAMLDGLTLFRLGVSFGGYESLVVPVDPRLFPGMATRHVEGPLLRLHVGLEDPADLIADLEEGFTRLRERSATEAAG